MKVSGKPENKWGWVRVVAYAVFAAVMVWTMASAGLRSIGEVPWMAWSGYHAFPLLKGLDLAIVPLLVAMVAGWLEEHERQKESDLIQRRESEHTLAVRRKEALKRLREAVRAVLSDEEQQDLTDASMPAWGKLSEIIRAVLNELDGKGKGEALHFLYEKKLLGREKPVVELHGANCRGAILTHAHLSGICLDEIDLSNAKMNGSHLARARLCGATLHKAFMQHADLRDAALNGCNLNGANLESANLEGADLSNAYLKTTFLRNANLKSCKLDILEQAILIDTVLPDGRKTTNENGKQYLRDKEFAMLIDKL